MFRRRKLSLIWGLLLLCAWASTPCSAQVRRYQPRTPTVSPYLNLTRLNNGALPNYYSFVRPQLHQRALNLREQALRRQQVGALKQLQNRVQRGQHTAAPTGTSSWFLTPGTQSTYLDTSGYYPGPARILGRAGNLR